MPLSTGTGFFMDPTTLSLTIATRLYLTFFPILCANIPPPVREVNFNAADCLLISAVISFPDLVWSSPCQFLTRNFTFFSNDPARHHLPKIPYHSTHPGVVVFLHRYFPRFLFSKSFRAVPQLCPAPTSWYLPSESPISVSRRPLLSRKASTHTIPPRNIPP